MKNQTGWLVKGYTNTPHDDGAPVYTKEAQYIDGALDALKAAMQAGATQVMAVAIYDNVTKG